MTDTDLKIRLWKGDHLMDRKLKSFPYDQRAVSGFASELAVAHMVMTPQRQLAIPDGGSRSLDTEHAALMVSVKKLTEMASATTFDRNGFLSAVDGFFDLLRSHFHHEDGILGKSPYPGASEHIEQHWEMLQSFLAYKARLVASENAFERVTLIFTIRGAIASHMSNSDIQFEDDMFF